MPVCRMFMGFGLGFLCSQGGGTGAGRERIPRVPTLPANTPFPPPLTGDTVVVRSIPGCVYWALTKRV